MHRIETPSPVQLTAQRRVIRSRTITNLRWFGVAGQAVVTLGVRLGLGFEMPLALIIGVIAVGFWMNLYLLFTQAPGKALSEKELTFHLLFDTAQIGTVLFLTGGIQNPFAIWLVLPAILASTSLQMLYARYVLTAVVVALTVITLVHFPLPWVTAEGYEWHRIYDFGTWAALMLGVAFTSSYAYQISNEQAKLSSALEAAQAVLSREEKVSALGGLAAAAAHELGTPLATIQVTAREMQLELSDGPLKEDAELLVSQTQRCQSILRRLSSADGDSHHDVLSLDDLLKEAAKPFLTSGACQIEFAFDPFSQTPTPDRLQRRAEVIYGLRALIENAAKYATSLVHVRAAWDSNEMTIHISDDGPGFSEGALNRLGEPFSQRNTPQGDDSKKGLGLGFFIAKTLLERTGGQIRYGNGERLSGAWVEVSWPLANLLADPISSQDEPRPTKVNG